jgi:citrate lyase subunit beta/citryl-CoA lyase
MPKVEDVDTVHFAHHLLNQLEWKLRLDRRLGLELQIETALGLENSAQIAAASSRSQALVFGPVDFAASMQLPGPDDPQRHPGDVWHYFLARMAVAARAGGLKAVDGPFVQVRDLDGLRESARLAAALGYDGKWALNPAQVEVLNEVFSPSQEDFDQAHRLVEAYRRATDVEGTGAVMLDGEMIDEASRKLAQATLDRGAAAGLKPRA